MSIVSHGCFRYNIPKLRPGRKCERGKNMKKLNIAVIGFGRSGCDIHGALLRTADNDICNVKYVVEADPNRAAAAREIFGCETLTDTSKWQNKSHIPHPTRARNK